MNNKFKDILFRKRNKIILEDNSFISDLNDLVNSAYSGLSDISEIKLTKENISYDEIIESIFTTGKYEIPINIDNQDILIDLDGNLNKDIEISDDVQSQIDACIKDIHEIIFAQINAICTVNENLMQFGYSLDKESLIELSKYSTNDMHDIYDFYANEIDQLVDASKKHEPMYPNFPEQVMEMSDFELYFNAIVHYLSGGVLYPNTEKEQREKLDEMTKYTYMGLGTEQEFYSIISNLFSSKVSISEQDRNDLVTFMDNTPNWKDYLPNEIPNKENMVFVANYIVDKKGGLENVTVDDLSMFKTPTDLLRFLAVRNGGSLTLDDIKTVKYGSELNKNAVRKLIMGILDNMGEHAGQDIITYKNAWKRIAEKIHPGTFDKKGQFPHAVDILVGPYELKKDLKKLQTEKNICESIFNGEDLHKCYKEYGVDQVNTVVEDINPELITSFKKNKDINTQLKQLKTQKDILNKKIKTCLEKDINEEKEYLELQVKIQQINVAKLEKNEELILKNKIIDNTGTIQSISDTQKYIYMAKTKNELKKAEFELVRRQKKLDEYDVEKLEDEQNKEVSDLQSRIDVIDFNIKSLEIEKRNTIDKDSVNLDNAKFAKHKESIDRQISYLQNKINNIEDYNKRVTQKFAEFLDKKDYLGGAKYLSNFPGIFARNLDLLVRKSENPKDIVDEFEKVANQVSPTVLLQLKSHIVHRNEEEDYRTYMRSGKILNVYVDKHTLDPLSDEICNRITSICESACIEQFKGKSDLNNVYIDSQYKKQLVPYALRNQPFGKESYVTGSRYALEDSVEKMKIENAPFLLELANIEIDRLNNSIDSLKETLVYLEENKDSFEEEYQSKKENIQQKIEEINEQLKEEQKNKETQENIIANKGKKSKAVRGFCWWTNINSEYNYVVDLDLSAVMYDKNYCPSGHVWYGDLKNAFAVHSGDITNGGPVNGNGVTEFVDIYPEEVLKSGSRYVMYQINSYTGQYFSQMPNAKFGWMEREHIKSGEIYEPKTVKQSLDLSAEANMLSAVIFDCVEREFIYANIPDRTSRCSNVLNTNEQQQAVLKAICEPQKENLYNLIQMNMIARNGHQVDCVAKLQPGDTAFVMEYPEEKIPGVNYVKCTDVDVFTSDLLREATKEEREHLLETEQDIDIR